MTKIKMMFKKPRKRYTEEFMGEAVEVRITCKTVSEIVGELCVRAGLPYRRKWDAQVGRKGIRAVFERSDSVDLRAFRKESVQL